MSKLLEMREKFPQTEIWMDSFHVEDHEYGLSQGITGITTSPTWISRMMCNEKGNEHKEVIQALQKEHPEYNEQEMTWAWVLEMGKRRSPVMMDLWKQNNPTIGRFSIQTAIYDYNNAEKMIEMAKQVDACNENMQVKIPATSAGIKAIEEVTYLGISAMATLCFTVDQAVEVAKAFENGLNRRTKEGLSNENINPVCAVLLGMNDDWTKMYAENNNIVIDPACYNYAGVTICKKIYKIFKERNYRARILVAYYRHQLHWSEFIGGDVIMTIPAKWQRRFETCDVEIKDNMSQDVPEVIMNQLNKLPAFRVAYNEGSLAKSDYNTFGPINLTIHYFTEEYDKAVKMTRNYMIPKPF